jgi:uncharacterized peroxidase-related enzyme
LLKNDRLVSDLEEDHAKADLSPRERAILDYAVKLTLFPSTMSEGDVHALREVGLTDSAILDACQVTSYYNYVNRLADGLGVELEEYWEQGGHADS